MALVCNKLLTVLNGVVISFEGPIERSAFKLLSLIGAQL